MHYNWHRHYDPSLGRYTQPDPLGFVDGPSVYAYAGNAPTEYVDPDGRIIRGIVKETAKQIINYCIRKLKEFSKDEQGGKKSRSPNVRQNEQAHAALEEAARDSGIEVTDKLRREFHDDITGQGIEGYQNLVQAARDFLKFRFTLDD